jgi:uncharacterized membrane protein YhaH (DUF805 family)
MQFWIKVLRLFTFVALFSSVVCFGQNNGGDPASGAAGCACCGTFIFIPIILFVLNIALLVWVARDAKARGMDSAVIWMLLVFILSLLGLVIYLFSRPQGNTVPCPNCGNKRLQASVKCPHCGIGS